MLLLASGIAMSQNPHGEAFQINCAACHSPEGWEIAESYWKEIELVKPKISETTGMPLPVDTTKFHHNKTDFPLTGQHDAVNCRSCHESLVFSEASGECISCHTDMHQMTVGSDCARCHTTDNWLVDNITDLHIENGFPLLGAHAVASCNDCHVSETALRFERIGNACINCHQDEYDATTNPDHAEAGFSTNCIDCHDATGFDWTTEIVDHSFFPLTKGHEINECAMCHIGGDFANTPTNCFACHQSDFEGTMVPDHEQANFVTDCASCHTTDPGWMPAEYLAHDNDYFPIYSGEHEGTWTTCQECHTDPGNFSVFTCTTCHVKDETDDEHDEVTGYIYESTACLACHPSGSAEESFDHNASNFPLTGAHLTVDCISCHAAGYTGTPTECAACHTEDYEGTTNPDHSGIGLSLDCASCHTTDPGWMPAGFAIHDEYYALNGSHALIANDCASCHNGDYVNTPNTCYGCHSEDYDNTTDPNHVSAQFSTDCVLCHNETAWEPSDFDHDAQHFPIYSGEHNGEWSMCTDCHTNLSNYAEVNCINCHTNPETNEGHEGVNGYVYENTACLACHPTGDVTNIFDHNMTAFPLTGAHLMTDCLACHSSGYEGTSTDCAACHQEDYNQSTNPGHVALGIPMDCASCHTTEPDWTPASFAIHNDYYPLNGAHADIANDCAACHGGDYVNTPNTCYGCHAADYASATEPNHQEHQFPTDCAGCHTESAWEPSTFDHNAYYPFTGAHQDISNDCNACHNGDYANTPNTCSGCHTQDYTETANPNHPELALPMDCATCHTTDAGWMPASFDIHNDYYALNGAHALIANDCAACHGGDYNNTPNTCFGCHAEDYSQTSNPDHEAAMFATDCATCHTESAWVPSTFDHDAQYFPIYSGEHNGEWDQCIDCHTNPNNYAEVSCINCHLNPETDEDHVGVNGYSYNNASCLACHPTGSAEDNFDHNNTGFPLTGAHITVECIDCHAAGYAGTPTDCAACHTDDYNQSSNPSHTDLGLSMDCASCHTTEPDWMPASFAVHNEYYALNGAHAAIANDCAACHNGDYINTPNTCFGCHADDYNQTINPDHEAAMFSTDCATCHTESAWVPSTFDHDAQYFPIYSGEHNGEWDQCIDCHTNPNNYAEVSCINCHLNPETDEDHVGVNGYSYNNASCLACHPTGSAEDNFDHNNTGFPLTGAHITVECIDCHAAGYAGTPTDCAACHTDDYNQSSNPSHTDLGLSMDCASCHTTEPDWMPASFAIHNEYYALNGAHAAIANDCAACHNGDYINTPNTCFGCHADDYNAAADPNHAANQFPTTCDQCHTETAWIPSTFDHEAIYPFTGAHIPIAEDCNACHNGDYSNTPNTCAGCHTPDYNASTNPDHVTLGIPNTCEMCHTTEPDWMPATFDIHNEYWPLNGAHAAISNECATCHNGDYNNTPNTCYGCHADDYNQTANPDHAEAGFPTTCDDCHSETAWVPATFDHDLFYPLTGAHELIANDCNICHMGNFSNTPNTCEGCHSDDYNESTNPNHTALALPMDCATCHTTDPDWMPALFPNHNNYWELNGAHAAISNDCAACHNGDYNNTPTTCFGCHADDYNATNDPDHAAVGFPTTCENCHTENAWTPSTWDHDNMYFPIYSGRHEGEWNVCTDCHIGGNYSSFSCIDCHEHDDPVELAEDHDEVPGYVYSSPACYSCHPTGED